MQFPGVRTALFVIICLIFLTDLGNAQILKADYLRYLERVAEIGWQEYPQVIERWKKSPNHHELWGYDAPGHPIYLADILGYLYQETKERHYAEKAREILASFGDLRETYPKELQVKRAEYRKGVPAISNFFIMPPYARAYLRIRESGVVDKNSREKIERDLAFSLNHTFHFPEWGAHNRAMLRAESLYYGAVALTHHPNAKRWKQLAETLAGDSLNQWEIEDATGYHAIWLYSLFSYGQISGQENLLQSPQIKYYLDYFAQLLTPHGNIADFGDSNWNGGWERFVPVYEKAASIYRNPHYKYTAQELARRALERMARAQKLDGIKMVNVGVGAGYAFTDAHRWANDELAAEKPSSLSLEVLDDIVGKKIVFRNGWERASTFLLLNYRDEGDSGWLGREYLRQTLSVEEEKMHHGHADENSISLLMSGGSVLLHDAGYRPDLPSGQWGAWRADYFHNRVVVRKNKRDKKQDVFEFLRNSGAYRRVRTRKIDFLRFRDVDMSRTRLIDDELGYQWDRIVTYIKEKDFFVIIDGVKAMRGDYFTFSNLWHTRQILSRDGQYFKTNIDKIGADELPGRSLSIYFPENSPGKQIGTFALQRHFQDENAIYQTISGFYNAGDWELFVTVLKPGPMRGDDNFQPTNFRMLDVDKPGRAVGIEIIDGNVRSAICIKLDLEMGLARENIRPRYAYHLGQVKYGDFETDASYLFARIGNGEVAYSAATMTKVLYRDQILMEALPNTFGLQLDSTPPRTSHAQWRLWEESIKIKER